MKLLPLLALLAIPIAHGADTTPAEKTDFAVGFDLQTSTTAPAYRVALHPETYRQLQRYDLADLAVFNSAGQPVPHALERPEAEETLPTQRPLPFYAIAKEGGQIAGALKLRVDAGGAVVQMEAHAGPQPRQPRFRRAVPVVDDHGTARVEEIGCSGGATRAVERRGGRGRARGPGL